MFVCVCVGSPYLLLACCHCNLFYLLSLMFCELVKSSTHSALSVSSKAFLFSVSVCVLSLSSSSELLFSLACVCVSLH